MVFGVRWLPVDDVTLAVNVKFTVSPTFTVTKVSCTTSVNEFEKLTAPRDPNVAGLEVMPARVIVQEADPVSPAMAPCDVTLTGCEKVNVQVGFAVPEPPVCAPATVNGAPDPDGAGDGVGNVPALL